MRTYLTWRNKTTGVTGLPAYQIMYWLRPVGGACEEDRQAFNALTVKDKIAQSTSVRPAGNWTARLCGTQPQDDILIPYLVDGKSFHPDDESVPSTPITGAYETRYFTTN